MPSSQSEDWPLRIWVKNLPSGVLESNLCSRGWTHHLWKAERRVLLVCPLPGEVLFSIPTVPLPTLCGGQRRAGVFLRWRLQLWLREPLGLRSCHSCQERTQVPQTFPTCAQSL